MPKQSRDPNDARWSMHSAVNTEQQAKFEVVFNKGLSRKTFSTIELAEQHLRSTLKGEGVVKPVERFR